MRDAKDYPNGTPIYTFVDGDTGENTHVDSEALRQWCAEHRSELEILNTPVDPLIAVSFLEENAIDLRHAAEVQRMPKLDPIIYGTVRIAENGNPDVLLIDGHHRYFLAFVAGMKFIPSFILKPEQWKPFIVAGLPTLTKEQLMAMPTKAEWQRMKAKEDKQ